MSVRGGRRESFHQSKKFLPKQSNSVQCSGSLYFTAASPGSGHCSRDIPPYRGNDVFGYRNESRSHLEVSNEKLGGYKTF